MPRGPGTAANPPRKGMKPTRTEYLLRLRPELGWQIPVEVRLRAALKRLLRTHGFVCTRCEPIEPPTDQPKAQE
jgi:hypothetical protein